MKKLSEEIAARIFRGGITARPFSNRRTPSTPPSSNVDQISEGVRIIHRIGDTIIAATHTKASVDGEIVFNHKNDKWLDKGRLLAIYSGNGRDFKDYLISFEKNLHSMNVFCMARQLGRLIESEKSPPNIEMVFAASYDQSLEGAARIQVENNTSIVTKLDITSPYFMGGCKAIAEGVYQDMARRFTSEPDVIKNDKLVMRETLCKVAKIDGGTGGYVSVRDSRTNKYGRQWVEKRIQQFKWPIHD